MQLPRNGVAKELRSYVGSLFIFLFVIGIIITLQFPVLESNKEVVMVLIGTVAASIPTGSLFIFLFVIGIIITLLQFPVLESNKEVVMVLIGTVAASIPTVISAITGTKPDDVNALKGDVAKRDQQIELLIKSKDDLEAMVIDLQREILKNQDEIMDKIVLKAALDFDDRVAAKSLLNKDKSK